MNLQMADEAPLYISIVFEHRMIYLIPCLHYWRLDWHLSVACILIIV